ERTRLHRIIDATPARSFALRSARVTMTAFLSIALAFPSVVYTVLLGAAVVYWVFVIVGAAHVNLLGDGAAGGALDGAGDGAADLGHADVGHAEVGHADVGDAGDAGGHADGGDADGGDGGDGDGNSGPGAHGLAGALAALKLRSAPLTVVLSCIILFA